MARQLNSPARTRSPIELTGESEGDGGKNNKKRRTRSVVGQEVVKKKQTPAASAAAGPRGTSAGPAFPVVGNNYKKRQREQELDGDGDARAEGRGSANNNHPNKRQKKNKSPESRSPSPGRPDRQKVIGVRKTGAKAGREDQKKPQKIYNSTEAGGSTPHRSPAAHLSRSPVVPPRQTHTTRKKCGTKLYRCCSEGLHPG